MRIKIIISFFVFAAIILLNTSCGNVEPGRYEVTPDAYGKPNHIMLVTDEYNWTTAIGDSFRTNFEALYPVTPQEEAIYDIRHKKPMEFEQAKIYKTNRAIIILAALNDNNDQAAEMIRKAIGPKNVERAKTDPSYRIAIHEDRWAAGQVVVYWFAPTREELLETVSQDYKKVMETFDKKDAALYLQQIYSPGQNHKVSELLRKDFDINMKIPRGYVLAHQDSMTMWLRKETNTISSNIFVRILPFADSTRAIPDQLKYIRNKYTKTYFSTWVDSSYMQIDDRVMKMYFQPMVFDGKQTLQARGLWGMVNDFMGGPFVTYMIEDEVNDRIILLDGFVHAPGQQKRPEMRKLDMIFSTFNVLEDKEE